MPAGLLPTQLAFDKCHLRNDTTRVRRHEAKLPLVSRIWKFVRNADAALAGTERERDRFLILSLIDGPSRYRHAGGASRGQCLNQLAPDGLPLGR